MKTLKHLFSLFLFLIISISSFAQSSGLSVKRFEDVSSVKQYARTQPRKDNNGEPAALVLVQVLASNIQVDFTANYLLGNVEKKASEYWVYMAAGAKSLEVHCDGYEKIRVDFSEVSKGQIPSLVKQCTYELVISVPGMMQNTTQAPQRQFFKFRVNPSNAVVTVWENGKEQILPMKEGVASKMFNYGTYSYRISANRYHSEEGSFTLSDTQREMSVTLRPKFGYLTVQGDNTSRGAYLFATNAQTGDMTQLGTIPLSNKELDAGTYTLHVQQNKYKDYSKTIVIEGGKTTSVRPVLDANFAQVTLTTQEGADILLDGSRLGTGRYSGTLELGEYVIETRQSGYKSSYTTLTITPQSTGKTIALNNPVPICGTLIVDGDPSDIAVYVDNKKEGTTPLVINKLFVGTHKVRLEKEGYDKQEKTITLSEGQELMLNFTLVKSTPKSTTHSSENHECVDLGLSVKWATCNVGANKPEDYGDYFAWGETKPKKSYSSLNYFYKDNLTTLPLSADAARANWGGSWRMPTRAEQDELREQCTWRWTTQNGVKGYMVTSKKNGKSIFLPAAGSRYVSSLLNAGSYGYYWSSSLSTSNTSDAYCLYFDSSYVDWYFYDRYYGRSVRPVCP